MKANYKVPKMGGMGGNPNAMLQQVQKMQADMAAKQQELEAREYEVSAGGGAVTVRINGQKQILSLDIAPEIVDPDDIETLSDILVAAVNEAIKRVEDTATAEMEAITGSVSLPGMGGLGGFPGLF